MQHAFIDFLLVRDTGLVSESVSVLIVPFQCLEIAGRAPRLLWLENYEHVVGVGHV